nr:reverse transcriptase domain-containing protein [Tanacetum cinerariifolium]
MADNRTMEELLQAPTKRDVPNDVIKLMTFPYSLDGNARAWDNASKSDDRIDKLADQISTLVDIFAKKIIIPAPVKAVEEYCVTCGGNHAYYNCPNTDSNQPSVCVATGTLPSNTIANPKGKMKAITTRSGVAYEGPSIPTPKKVVEQETDETTDKEQLNFQGSNAHIQPPVIPIPKPDVSKTLPKPNLPYPLRLNDQKLCEKATNQMEKGRLLASFQDLEHEGGDTRSQGDIKDNDSKIKIQDHWHANDHSNEFPRTRLQVSRKIKDRLKATRDHQKSYADKRRKPLEFSVGNYVLLKVFPWKGLVRFGKKGKLASRFVGPFEIVEKVGLVAYRLDLPEELDGVHDTFHVSNLKKFLADPTLQVPLDEIQVDAKLNFMEEPMKILERESLRS